VLFPDLSGCTSAGDTIEEAAVSAAEALAGHLQARADVGEAVPEPSEPGLVPGWLAELPGNRIVAHIMVPVDTPAATVQS